MSAAAAACPHQLRWDDGDEAMGQPPGTGRGRGQRAIPLGAALPSRLAPPLEALLARCSRAGRLPELLGTATASGAITFFPPSCAGAGQILQISAPNSCDFCGIGRQLGQGGSLPHQGRDGSGCLCTLVAAAPLGFPGDSQVTDGSLQAKLPGGMSPTRRCAWRPSVAHAALEGRGRSHAAGTEAGSQGHPGGCGRWLPRGPGRPHRGGC